MKTTIEIQHKELNIKDVNIDKYIKEQLKEKGVKATDVDTLNVYYIPDQLNVYYVAKKKDGTEIKDSFDAHLVPEYPEAPVKKATRKTPVKKAEKPAAKVAAKPVVKPVVKAAAKPTAKASKKVALKK
ncbi:MULTISPECIES: hypothetical protein [Coprobacillaceae]|uniref:hypothetical protein n=1 Tax=Coprobacillaceae TaxID=2810280 RepID=UPI000E53360E|nr:MULTISPECIES: hypothetical protein [Coprobacillaceae]RHM61329.1 hypothetical protein DWZ53_05355 [Coprobacillus sp. AF33-1AC]RHS95910.1 hypothetical protein DW911_02580 [Erysipelatoclostridium sp. AM42-17]